MEEKASLARDEDTLLDFSQAFPSPAKSVKAKGDPLDQKWPEFKEHSGEGLCRASQTSQRARPFSGVPYILKNKNAKRELYILW